MIRGVVVHLIGEQPLLADIEAVPDPGDPGFLCTNLRLMNGNKPHFIDESDSWFLIPLSQLRFVEMRGARLSRPRARTAGAPSTMRSIPDDTLDLELDEDLLRRVREA